MVQATEILMGLCHLNLSVNTSFRRGAGGHNLKVLTANYCKTLSIYSKFWENPRCCSCLMKTEDDIGFPSAQDSNYTLNTVYPSLLAKAKRGVRKCNLFLKLPCFLFRRLFSCTIQHLVCAWPQWDHLLWRWRSVMTQTLKNGSSVLIEGIKENIFKSYIVVDI